MTPAQRILAALLAALASTVAVPALAVPAPTTPVPAMTAAAPSALVAPAPTAAASTALAPVALAGEPDPATLLATLRLGADARVCLDDMDGDGRRDLLIVDGSGLSLRHQRAGGRYPDVPDARLDWPGDDVGWDVADLDADGDRELLLLVDGAELSVIDVADGAFAEPVVLVATAQGTLPRGRRRVAFARDVDGDGRPDVVVPSSGSYRIFLAAADGTLGTPLEVAYEADVDYEVGDPQGLHGRFGQDVRIPWFSMRDVDGDGLQDLVSQTKDVVLFHLAAPGLPREATWRIDLAALREENARQGFDLDNLFANLDARVTWRVVDLDGQPPHDLILQQGGTFRIWLGGGTGAVDRVPDRVLKSSGNVLHYLVRDVQGDPRPELQIIRGDQVSLGQVVRWLIIPGALHFDVFTYANEDLFRQDGRLVPNRRARVTLEIPRLLSFIEEFEEIKDEMEARLAVPARKLCLDGDGVQDDIADVVEGRLLVYRDAVPVDLEQSLVEQLAGLDLDSLLEVFILQDLDARADGSTQVIDLGDIRELRITPGHELRQAARGRQPALALETTFGEVAPEIHVTDLDGDGRSELVLVGELDDAGVRTVLLVGLR